MKIHLLTGLLILMISCNSNDPEALRKKIILKKEQIARINNSIKNLENKLHKDTANVHFQIPIEIKKVRYEPFRHYIEAQGSIEAVEDAYISPEMGGRIKKIVGLLDC
mgnify:CR=1 FL=1